MASREQGTYEDEVRVFDGAEDEEDEEGSRLPLLIVIALLVLSAFGGVVWLAYEHGVANGRSEPRLLTADAGPVKVAPTNPGGTETPYKGLKIYEQQAPSDEESDRAPPSSNANHIASASPATPTTAMSSPGLRPPLETTAPKSQDKVATIDTEPERTAPPPQPTAVPSHKPTVSAQAEPDVVPVARLATRGPAALTQTEPATTSPSSDATSTPHAATSAYVLQIGSYKSPDEANASWESFKARHAALLSGHSEDVKRVDLGDKGTWYRLRLTSFVDKASASDFCDKLKANGGNCFLSK